MTGDNSIKQLLHKAAASISSDSPRLDAEILLCHLLNKPRSHLFTWPEQVLEPKLVETFLKLVQRRCAGEPVAYLTGQQEFWSLQLKVSPAVLIPRPDTELLVELALQWPANTPLDVLDLGTGSGAIALALASERPAWRITATDQSEEVLNIARDNAGRHQLSNVRFNQGSWYQAVTSQTFDLIVSNPPYIPAADPHLATGGLQFEPEQALVSGVIGLDDIEAIAGEAVRYLNDNGWLLVEHGYDQGTAVRQIFERHGLETVRTELDLEGRERVTLGTLNESS
ncbi:MAG TPA: peptide chain release factor N(5)-glutamine methyltransferase [Gammaproteobacteria bacterium]|nr:peptide chain release factor N(5)-glutamine methyltransferase [Gammaproteobacteria bacterium]